MGLMNHTMHMSRGTRRLYATVELGNALVIQTNIVEMETQNPKWGECNQIYCAHYTSEVVISVKDAGLLGSHVKGRARIPVQTLLSGDKIEGMHDLYNDNGSKVGRVNVSLQFFKIQRDCNDGWTLRNASFSPRENCRVKLYQDADMQDGFLPEIHLSGGQLFQPSCCWKDIYEAISNAKIFIYIAGWSVYTKISLLRYGDTVSETLGDLLKRKAEEGVCVALLVWDDRTSIGSVKQQGIMEHMMKVP